MAHWGSFEKPGCVQRILQVGWKRRGLPQTPSHLELLVAVERVLDWEESDTYKLRKYKGRGGFRWKTDARMLDSLGSADIRVCTGLPTVTEVTLCDD